MSFFQKVDDILRKLNDADTEMNRFATSVLQSAEIESLMVRYNQAQLNKGERADGSRLPDYKPSTIARKAKKGQPTDRMTLYDHGNFYAEMRVRRYPGKAELLSLDEKAALLTNKYGYGIMGISYENKMKIREYIKPRIIAHAKKYMSS